MSPDAYMTKAEERRQARRRDCPTTGRGAFRGKRYRIVNRRNRLIERRILRYLAAGQVEKAEKWWTYYVSPETSPARWRAEMMAWAAKEGA